MHMVRVACNCIFWRNAQLLLILNFDYKDFNSTAKESSKFPTRDFFGGFLGDFWPDFGGLIRCPDKLRESPKACRKIRTKVSRRWTDLHRGNPGS